MRASYASRLIWRRSLRSITMFDPRHPNEVRMSRSKRVFSMLFVLLVAACGSALAAAADVIVFAAASLKEAMDQQGKEFEAKTGGKVVVSYGASNARAKQTTRGESAQL